MKLFLFTAIGVATTLSALAGTTNTYEKFSPHIPANSPIIWEAPMDDLPDSFLIYHKFRPHIFPATVISNAFVLANYLNRGIPLPSTNETCIVDDPDCHCHCMIICNLSIRPGEGILTYDSPGKNDSTQAIPDGQTLTNLAWQYARELQVDPRQAVLKDIVTHFNRNTNDVALTNQISGRGAFFSRQLGSMPFLGNGNDGFVTEGFYIEFGSYGTIRSFSLIWPELEAYRTEKTITPQQIIACLRTHKLSVAPEGDGDTNFFGRIKMLAAAKSLTIKKIIPYYTDSWYEEKISEQEYPKFAAPIAQLEAVADLGTSNVIIHIFSPLTSSTAERLLAE